LLNALSVLNTLLDKPARALLFDLDGTLVDSVPDLAAAIDAMLIDMGYKPAGEQRVRHWVGNGAVKLVQRALTYAQQGDESTLLDENLQDWQSAHQCFLKHYGRLSPDFSCLYPGVIEAITAWHQQGVAMAVVTNKPKQFVPEILQHFALDIFFPVIVGGDCLLQRKPSPEPLYFACEQLSVSANECIMIGDSKNDVGAARAAGMSVACVSYGYNHGEPIERAKPDIVVDSLMQLL